MAKAVQLALMLEPEVGTLARFCRTLAEGGVNLLGLNAPEEQSRGPLRILVGNRDIAVRALTRAGYRFDEEQVIFVELNNRPGGLARAVEKLARAGIDIRYAYATAYTRARKTAAVLAVPPEDLDRASRLVR